MRVFAVSDIHVDYDVNARWVQALSSVDYRDDVLILAGDVSDSVDLLSFTVETLAKRFKTVMFVPGNHDLWVRQSPPALTSLEKFEQVRHLIKACGGLMEPWLCDDVAIVPLLSWYDFSFGQPGLELRQSWMDFRTCRWPQGYAEAEVTQHFLALNQPALAAIKHDQVITFSHFLPRIDLMPSYIPAQFRALYPVLGTAALDEQIRRLNPLIHVYGHSHVNRQLVLNGVQYINNAFGYPAETRIAEKQLKCIFDSSLARRRMSGQGDWP
jgi:Icc-related predicted phosphoesterase